MIVDRPHFGDFAEPTSFLPQMASVSAVIENIANRRMQLAKQEQAEAHAREKDAYYRSKLEAGERKQEASERFQRAKLGQEEMKRASGLIGSGKHPGVGLVQDEQGNPYYVTWRWVGGKKKAELVPATPEAAPPAAESSAPQLKMPEMAPNQAPQGLTPQLRRPTFAGGPLPPTAVQGSFHRLQPQQPDEMFLDEVAGEDARAIPETAGEPGKTIDLPTQAFPEGAREGQRFNAADVNMRGGYGNPFAEPLPPLNLRRPDQMFADEISDGTARVIPETMGEPGRTMELPQQALPEGAREGQRFAAGDVNLKGGYGNPFAEPVPPQPAPQVERQPMPEAPMQLGGEAEVTSVPPTSVQGARYEQPQMPQQDDEEGRWEADLPGGQKLAIRPGEARAASQADKEALASQLVAMANDPATDPAEKARIARVLPYLVVSGMDPKVGAQLIGQSGAENLEGVKQTGRESLEGIKAENAVGLEGVKHKNRVELKKTRKGGGSGVGGSGLGGAKIEAAMNIPIPVTKYGSRPDMLLARVDQEWRYMAIDIKMSDQLKGLRRIVQAEHNIEVRGDGSDLVNAEAFFNFAGATRGGVPVENESKVMWEQRKTWAMKIKGYLARAGLGKVAAEFMAGRELTPEEAAAAQKTMTPEELKMMAIGIKESKKILAQQVAESVKPFVSIYGKFGGKGGELMREHAVSLVNSRLAAAGLPADYAPYGAKTAQQGGKEASPAPAEPGSTSDDGSIGSLVRQLKPVKPVGAK